MNTTMMLLPEQRENTKHGELLFPIQKYTTHLSPDTPLVIPHWHEEAEFTLITEGDCLYQLQLENYEVHSGDLVFVAPLQLHSITRKTEEMLSDTYVFHMNFLGTNMNDRCSIQYLAPLSKQTLIPPAILPPSHPIYPEALKLFQKINHSWAAQETGYELTVKACLLTLITLLLPYCMESSNISKLQTEHTQKIKTALEYIAHHYTEEITVADVAASCYFSEYYFMRFFKKHVGMSCMDYIKNLRLEKAVHLFETGTQSILDVSLTCGFRNLPYFYREFKKKYGMTPKQYIKQIIF